MSIPNPNSTSNPNPNPTETETETETETIDALLAHYLILLDEYTTLRGALNTLQASMYQSLARANFAADRGIRRYGQDYYDERMQAGRRLQITLEGGVGVGARDVGSGMVAVGEEGKGVRTGTGTESGTGRGSAAVGGGSAVFALRVYPDSTAEGVNKPEAEDEEEPGSTEEERGPTPGEGDGPVSADHKDDKHRRNDTEDNNQKQQLNRTSRSPEPEQPTSSSEEPTNLETNPKPKPEPEKETNRDPKPNPRKNDPLRWFGILTPPPLRQAQSHATNAVEEIIPRLATISAEMASVELEVRRARKRRAKLEKMGKTGKSVDVGGLEEKMGRVDVVG